jgi:hypothetical protein
LAALSGSGGESDDETIDDSLDEILLEARDKPLENPLPSEPEGASTETPPPKSANQTLLGVSASSLPLPGLAPPAPPPPAALEAESALPDEDDEDKRDTDTRRAAVVDSDDEPTKAEGARTPKVEQDTVLVEQASIERERALNRAVPPAPRMPTRPLGKLPVEFEDPDDDDDDTDGDGREFDASANQETPGAIAIEEESIESEEEAYNAAPAAPAYGPPPGMALTPRNLRPTPYPTTRLPTPIPGFSPLPGSPAYGSPAYSPNPPYGSATPSPGYGVPSLASSYASGRVSTPAVPIPPPSGAVAPLGRSRIFSKVQLPLGGLVAFVGAAFIGGLVFGALLWRGRAVEAQAIVPPAPVRVAAPAPAPAPAAAPAAAPVVAATPPVAQPAQPTPAAPAPAAAAAAHAPTPAPAPVATELPPPPETPPPAPVATRPVRRAPAPKPATPRVATAAPAVARTPKPAKKAPVATTAASSKKGGKEWVDPFAQ